MTVRSLYSLATAVGLCLASSTYAQQSAYAQQPARKATPTKAVVQPNQQLADAVAAHISKSGTAEGAKISLAANNGIVELSGDVSSMKQAQAIVEQVMLVPGVVKVESALKLATKLDVVPVVNAEQAPIVIPPPGGAGSSQILPQEPLPLAAPGMPNFDMPGPKLPPYSWPTYAPYPNLSRVAYPQAYPYNAFPFIGPYYPFPKVPLGWRSVKLEWDDGHWYLGRLSTPHDYWRVKFW